MRARARAPDLLTRTRAQPALANVALAGLADLFWAAGRWCAANKMGAGAEFAAQAKSAYAFASAMDKERGLSYQDICKPAWLLQEPELFYGFWGGQFH